MTILFYVVLTLHVIACLFLIAVVLLQQGKGQDLASTFGGGVTQTAFGPRGSANILSRATTVLAGVFMVTSLALTVVRPHSSVLEQAGPGSPAPAAAPSKPASNAPASNAPVSAPASNAPASAPAQNAPAK
jgi:preprotein translocase subunit SecG